MSRLVEPGERIGDRHRWHDLKCMYFFFALDPSARLLQFSSKGEGGWVGGARVGEGSGKLQVAENGRGGAAGGAGCCYFWIGSHPLKAKGERKKERTNKIERGRERERERVGRRAFVMDILFQP